MDFEFSNDDLAKLDSDPRFNARLPAAVVKSFRKTMQWIRAAKDERDFYARKSLRFEKLRRDPNQRSMRLNDQYRLIVRLKGKGSNKTVIVVAIEDYH